MTGSTHFEIAIDPEHGPVVRCSNIEAVDAFSDYLTEARDLPFMLAIEGPLTTFYLGKEISADGSHLGESISAEMARELVDSFFAMANAKA